MPPAKHSHKLTIELPAEYKELEAPLSEILAEIVEESIAEQTERFSAEVAAIRDHFDAKFTELREHLDTAFIGGDPVEHRKGHELNVKFMNDRIKLWEDIRSKTLVGLVWMFVLFAGQAAWALLVQRLGGSK